MKVKAHLHHALFRVIALSTIAGLAASGCSLPNTTQIDYKSTGKSKISALEMPPDIVNAPENPAEVSSRVLTPVSGMHIERADHARWLVVEHKTPEQLWPQLRAFWQAQGFRLLADAAPRGVLETDWKISRARLDQGILRNTLSKVDRLGGAYMASEKHQFRTRLLAKANGQTWILIHHQAQREALGLAKETAQWQAAPNDSGLEAEYLQRLMYALAGEGMPRTLTGEGAHGEQRPLKEEEEERAMTPSMQALEHCSARLHKERARRQYGDRYGQSRSPSRSDGGDPVAIPDTENAEATQGKPMKNALAPAQLNLNAPFDQVWPQTGLALERANLTIAERNRLQGIYICVMTLGLPSQRSPGEPACGAGSSRKKKTNRRSGTYKKSSRWMPAQHGFLLRMRRQTRIHQRPRGIFCNCCASNCIRAFFSGVHCAASRSRKCTLTEKCSSSRRTLP